MKATVVVGASATMLALVGGAQAAPTNAKKAEVVPVDCGSNGHYDVVTNGNGRWTPGHDTDSNVVLIPTAFGAFSGTFTPTGGQPEQISDPPISKHTSPPNNHPTFTCTYTVNFSDENGTFQGSGTVTVFRANQ